MEVIKKNYFRKKIFSNYINYHFRRVVVQPLLGKAEFWIYLKTGSKSEASLSATALRAQTSAFFGMACLMTNTTQSKRLAKEYIIKKEKDILRLLQIEQYDPLMDTC